MVRWIALVLVLVPATASAGFMNKKSDWDQLDAFSKDGYVMGVFDQVETQYTDLDMLNKYSTDLRNCVFDLELLSTHLVEIVENEYRELSNWDKPPKVVLSMGLRKVCLVHMNRARATRGDELLEP